MPASGVLELWRGDDCLGAAVHFAGAAPMRLLIDDPAREAHERILQAWERSHPKASDEVRRRAVMMWVHLAAPDVQVRTDGYRLSEWARAAWERACDGPIDQALALIRIQLTSVRDAGRNRPRSAPGLFSLSPADLSAATHQGTLTWRPVCGVARATWCQMPEGLIYLALFPWEGGALLCAVSGSFLKTSVRGDVGRLGELVAPADTVAALAVKAEWRAPEGDWGARLAALPKPRTGDLTSIAPSGLYLIEMGRLDAVLAGSPCLFTTWVVIHIPSGKQVYEGKHEAGSGGARGVKQVEFAGGDEVELTHEDGRVERMRLGAP